MFTCFRVHLTTIHGQHPILHCGHPEKLQPDANQKWLKFIVVCRDREALRQTDLQFVCISLEIFRHPSAGKYLSSVFCSLNTQPLGRQVDRQSGISACTTTVNIQAGHAMHQCSLIKYIQKTTQSLEIRLCLTDFH